MHAIEFKAKAVDGIVKIPPEYEDQVAGDVRVIILMDNQGRKTRFRKKSRLTSDPIKVKKIILPSREAIHAR